MRLVYVDIDRCLGCFSCERACSLKQYQDHKSAQSNIHVLIDMDRRAIKTSTCLQCGKPLCEAACPIQALHKDPMTHILVVDREACIGCGKCIEACPFDNVRLEANLGVASKCDLCGGQPRCVQVCQAQALQFGRLNEVRRRIKGKEKPNLVVRAIEGKNSKT